MLQILAELSTNGLLTITPLLLALVVAALAVPFLMGGWVFS
jgi:flagellar biosynthesis protein FlhB